MTFFNTAARATRHAAAALAVAATLAAGDLRAQLITYTFAGTASGTVDGTAFTATPFTVNIRGNRGAVDPALFGPTTSGIESLTGTIRFGANPIATFSNTLFVFNNRTTGVVGFGTDVNGDLLALLDGDLVGYDLRSNFSPPATDAGPAFDGFFDVFTSAGTVSVTSVTDATFGATVSTIPEPGTWALMLTGLVGVGAVARRRRAKG